ncbi:SDR family NAD(P)-dependent oxidoreductase [Amycolatopsis sp. NPDC051903]|uniref:SDR family NAD(P)-dependent oxidoreductase n=1 Tax=Amycolatopsis sp. NPDC051903 TaxID=3363936 RepID=UPI00379DBEBE
MGKLSSRVTVVTGGTRGLGRQIVEAFAGEVAAVVIASRNGVAREEAASQVRREHGVEALAVECNIGDWSACERLLDGLSPRGRPPLEATRSAVPHKYLDQLDVINNPAEH